MTTELDDQKICAKCQMPLEKKGSGSLTQWIKVCNCGRLSAAKESLEPVGICSTCGKRSEAGRSGTLTQWIFRADLCTCKSPSWVKAKALDSQGNVSSTENNVSASTSETAGGASENLDTSSSTEAEELPLDSDKFPLDRYAPLRQLGRGASGTVYLCRDRLLKKKVAVKVLNTLSPEQLVAFQREAKATSQIEHTNIVKILDFGVSGGVAPFMVLEYIDGVSLAELLENKGCIELEEALPIFEQLCDALIFAHRQNLFHRDVKPSNIILGGIETGEIRARLIDFGVGAFKQENTSQGKSVAGSPSYMSPDQARGLEFDERSEVYSLGCVMFEVLAGQCPFAGGTPLEIISMHAHQEPPTLSEAHGSMIFSDAVENVVATCLQKAPEERFSNVAELKHMLVELRQQSGVSNARSSNLMHQEFSAQGSNARLFVALAISVAAIGTVIGVIMFRPESSKPVSGSASTKQKYEEPKLSDALDSIESDVWYRGYDYLGSETWTSGPKLRDEDFKLLVKEKDIRRITVNLTDFVTGAGMSALKDREIEEFSTKSTGFSDEGLKILSEIKTIQLVRLSMASKITAAGLRYISTLPNLQALDLTVMRVPDGGLDEVAKMRNLKHLSLYNAHNITNADIEKIQHLPLEFLDLSGAAVTNAVIPTLSKIKTLKSLRLSKLNLTDKHLEMLCQIPNLMVLHVAENPRITDNGLKKLENLKNLKALVLADCTGLTSAGRAQFKKAHPTIRMTEVSDRGSAIMNSLESLSQ